ncbi:MAG: hypothetical protein EPO02_11605 [Nitrospirae bacterium]|nr:MAG: hypothetical protein EPO02_11605 [Nitrospirota bacterium]
MRRAARLTGIGRVSARPGWAGVIGCAVIGFVLLLAVPAADAAPSSGADGELTALLVRYYSALKKERWGEAFGLLHERLKKGMNVQSPQELAVRSIVAQQNLIAGFRRFDNLEVARTEVDLTSIKGMVTGAGDGNVAGQVVYDLVVFPIGKGRPLMYRVVMDVGLAQGQIIRLSQASMVRIDPGSVGDVL